MSAKFGAAVAATLVLTAASAALACPDWQYNGDQYAFTGDDLWQPRQFGVVAGGETTVRGCRIKFGSDSGRGYVPVRPDFTIQIRGLSRYQLQASVYSECDSVLVMNTGTESWFYDDDDNLDSALDARIILTRPQDGIFDFWIGTHDGEYCDAYLELETFMR